MILAATFAFANGGAEEVEAEATGVVLDIIPDDSPDSDEVLVVLSTADGEFRFELTQAIVDSLGLTIGEEITISGIVKAEDEDGVTTLKADVVTIEGQEFIVEDESDDESDDDESDDDDDDDDDDEDDDDHDDEDDEDDEDDND